MEGMKLAIRELIMSIIKIPAREFVVVRKK